MFAGFPSAIRRHLLAMSLFWTAAVAGSLWWNLDSVAENTRRVAYGQAVSSFEKDLLYRLWVNNNGGVYVPVSEKSPPNPYLEFLEDRDITLPNGRKLTLVNGAYMTRQVHELAKDLFQTKGHITSLRPVRPQNQPDEWERRALDAFEQGVKEISSIEQVGDKPYLRFMRPMVADGPCLRCHSKDGYKKGDIRGGISVSVPMEPLLETERRQSLRIASGHGALWVLGLAALFFLSRNLREQIIQREQAETRLNDSERRLSYLASHDPLTHLPNRALFHDRLSGAIQRAKRSNRMMAVIFIDLDHFKEVNDALGHATGDALLQAAAVRLTGALREVDTVARLGGDEFAVIMEEIEGEGEVEAAAVRILQSFAAPFRAAERELHLGASIGVSLFPTDGADAGMLTMNADSAMYRAKEKGRGNFQFFTGELSNKVERNLTLANDLRRAIERDELMLYYQPQVRIDSRRIVGMEALLRWRHPVFGLVPPLDFIPLAEAGGQIIQVGAWVLRSACLQNRRWHDAGQRDLVVAVNLAARQFREAGLVESVAAILTETGLAARHLELEITESAVMEDPAAAIVTLQQLKKLGVRLSVDDFGTGYSSLSYLKQFPLDVLKIDRSFVRDIVSDSHDEAIASAIINLAQELQLEVIAEGVETEDQLALLRRLNCRYAQGFLFDKPLPVEEASSRLSGKP